MKNNVSKRIVKYLDNYKTEMIKDLEILEEQIKCKEIQVKRMAQRIDSYDKYIQKQFPVDKQAVPYSYQYFLENIYEGDKK